MSDHNYTLACARALRLKAQALQADAAAYRIHPYMPPAKREDMARFYEGQAASTLDMAAELEAEAVAA